MSVASGSQSDMKQQSSFSSPESPSKRGKLAEGLISDPVRYKTQFEQGQIVRISLKNWVTFDFTEIGCEPGLNLIVGPNGTGKSSIVCAICLGLGGKPKSLGRGERVQDFIKYGRDKAFIEIELYNHNKSNDIIKRLISKTGTKWKLNGKTCTASKIEQFVKEKRNIKVDNLCQFLAQDRVSEFSRLSPKQLLIETEKAIENDQLYKWHQFLIDQGEKASDKQNEITNLQKTMQQNKSELDTLHKSIEQFECKKVMEKQLINYQALYEWNKVNDKYKDYKITMKETKKLQKKYLRKKSNITPLKKEGNKWCKQLKIMNNKITKYTKEVQKVQQRKNNGIKRIEKLADHIKEFEDDIKQNNQDLKDRHKRIKKLRQDIEKYENDYNQLDHQQIENAKQEKNKITRGLLKNARTEKRKIEQTLKNVNMKKKNVEHNLKKIKQDLERLTNATKQKEKYIFGGNRRKEKQFKSWIEANRHEFHGHVYGPIVQEMTVKSDIFATFLSAQIPFKVFYGYVCEDEKDWKRLLKEAAKLDLSINVYTVSSNNNNNNNNNQYMLQRPVDHRILNEYEVDGYLDEIFEAPDIIKKVLNDNLGLHRRAYSTKDLNERCLDNVLVTHKKQKGRLHSLITPNISYRINESRYSENVLRSMNALKKIPKNNQILKPTPDHTQEIYAKQQEQKKWHQELDVIDKEKRNLENDQKMAVAQINKLNDKKKQFEDIIKKCNSITNRLTKKRKDLQELEDDDNKENNLNEELTERIKKKNIDRVSTFDKLANDMEILYNMLKKTAAYQISKKYFDQRIKHCQQRIKEIQIKHQELQSAFNKSRKKEKYLKKEYDGLLREASENYPKKKFYKYWSEDDKKLGFEEIMDKINHLHGRINVLLIDQSRIDRYNRLKKTICSQSRKLSELENEQSVQENAIKDIENKWRPQLQDAVDKISLKFGEFFKQFNNAEGEVRLIWNEDDEYKYSEYHIDILTKFRLNEDYRRLTSASHSGGEKSISTMLYLLSLQQVTTVPFRVVDEINQGMDPLNERRIMQILNFECTPKPSQYGQIKLPQYFVVTPKLLPRLEYSPCSSVFVIFNGPYQISQIYWKYKEFVQSQQALSGSSNNNNNNNNNDDDNDENQEIDHNDI